MTTSLINFYQKHSISPVRQDIRDLKVHFDRRESLYRQLGILPAFFSNKNVLEIGPGSGFNSLFIAALKPANFVLVEGNPKGVEDIETLFSGYPDLNRGIQIAPVLLEDYEGSDLFDFVLCEGVLGLAGVPEPKNFLRQVASFVAPGGVLVITCVDDISFFAETLRRLFAHLLIEPGDTLETQLKKLVPVFSPHLSLLNGMSRLHEDWIIDNCINPASIGPVLSIPKAISSIADNFDIYASSPHFITDWRWYKSIICDNKHFNQRTINQYWQNVHNFFDYRYMYPPRSEDMNRQLYEMCRTVRDTIREFEHGRDLQSVQNIRHLLGEIILLTKNFSIEISEAIKEAQSLLIPPVNRTLLSESKQFGTFFGRGQQYLSFSRRHSLGSVEHFE